MSEGLFFAIAAALVFGLWTVFHKQAASQIDSLLGAIIVSVTAAFIGIIFFLPKLKTAVFQVSPKGIIFAVFAGIFALLLDFFVLKSYGSGFPISIGAPIVIGGSIAVASIVGLFLGESVTLAKILGLVFVIAGSGMLAAFSK